MAKRPSTVDDATREGLSFNPMARTEAAQQEGVKLALAQDGVRMAPQVIQAVQHATRGPAFHRMVFRLWLHALGLGVGRIPGSSRLYIGVQAPDLDVLQLAPDLTGNHPARR